MPHDHPTRAARVRLAQCVGAATAVVVCSLVAALSAGMSASADTEGAVAAHGSARRHAPEAGALGAATKSPVAGTSRPTPTRKPATPVDTTAVSTLAASGIPATALNAYRVAAARLGHAQPSCGISWYLLAGIGRVESDHGQFGGAVLHRDGLSTPRTIGPALNGKGNQFIPAPPNGLALDGDAKYAHALGPMQFIPSTWAGWGADANGDGIADIFNINDAALAAARYLCAAGGDLRSAAGQSAAVLSYNHLTSYRDEVLALADAYRRGITPTGPMIGNTTGSLPAAGHTGALPPATAGSPPATAPQRPAPPRAATPGAPTSARPTSGGAYPGAPTSRPTTSHTSPGRPTSPTPSCSPSTSSSSSPSSSSSSASPSSSASSRTPPPSPSSSASSSPSCAINACCPSAGRGS